MSYFTAVLARNGRTWLPREIDVESAADLQELATEMALVAFSPDDPVLAFVEREDAWWGIVRVDGDEDPRVFVSDVAGVAASPFADVLPVETEGDEEPPGEGSCAGDFDVLSDLGTPPEALRQMCEDELLPMDALATIAEAGGFAEVLDSLR